MNDDGLICMCGHTDSEHGADDACQVLGCDCDNFKRD